MRPEIDYTRQRTVAELLAEHGEGGPGGRRRRRRGDGPDGPVYFCGTGCRMAYLDDPAAYPL